MNVYRIYPTYSYCGGCALVAAETQNKAEFVYRQNTTGNDKWEYADCNILLETSLECHTNKPKIIFDTIYCE